MIALFSAEEYASRRARLAEALAVQAVDLAVVSHPPDLFYLAGTCQASHLVFNRAGEAVLAVRRGLERARMEATLPAEAIGGGGLAALIGRLAPDGFRRLGLAFEVTPHATAAILGRYFPAVDLVDLEPILGHLRQAKSGKEIELIRLAGRQLVGAFKTAASLLRLGQSELDLAIRIEAYLRRKGHPGVVRLRRSSAGASMGFVLAGASTLLAPELDTICTGPGLSPAAPFGPSDREFRASDPVLFDYCGCCGGYFAEASRMLSLGPPPPEAGWAYEAMRQVLRRVEGQLGPGQAAADLYALAWREVRLLGCDDQFMGTGGRQLAFIGHGVGLELDEPPYLSRSCQDRLVPGMVVAIDPKVVLPGIGVVGLGNTYLVTPDGFASLTPAEEDWRQVPLD